MMVKSAKFITSKTNISQITELRDLPMVAFAGRSNVGKSSLINMLVNQKGLAITSSTPGRTRLINFFEVRLQENKDLYFVDLPGYGFAKASKSMVGGWGDNIEEFLKSGISLCMVLVDIRIPPTEYDRMMILFLQQNSIPFKIIATKADKLSKAELGRTIQKFASATGITPQDIISTSAKNKLGREQVLLDIAQKI